METALEVDLNLLRALNALIDTGSVTMAAHRLGVGQPAMSRALASLRDQLGDPLLVRDGRGMARTPRAEALREPVRAALQAAQGVLAAGVGFEPGRDAGLVRVAIAPALRGVLLAPLLGHIQAHASHIEVRIVDLEGADPASDVDLVLWLDDPAAEGAVTIGRSLVRRELAGVDLVVAFAPDHPLAKRTLDVAAWVAYPHVVVDPLGQAQAGLVDEALAARGVSRRVVARVPDVAASLSAVRSGALVTTVPRPCTAGLQVVVRAPPLPLPTGRVLLGWHPRVADDPRVAWVRGEIATHASEWLGS